MKRRGACGGTGISTRPVSWGRWFGPLLLLLSVCGPSFAQQQPPVGNPPPEGQSPIEGDSFSFVIPDFGLPNDPFDRGVLGQFTGDEDKDMVGLRSGSPYLFAGPNLYQAVIQFPPEADGSNDVDVFHGGGPGGVDEVVTATADGLRLWTRSGGAWQAPQALGRDLIWEDARAIRVGFLDGDGSEDICGIRRDGDRVAIITDPFGPGMLEKTFLIGNPPREILPFDLEGDGVMELALRGDLGLDIYTLDGVSVASFAAEEPGGALAATRLEGDDGDTLVWITRGNGNTTDLLFTYDGQGGLSAPLDLGDLGAVAAATADLSGDGILDVVVNHQSSYDLKVLIPDAFGFSTTGGGMRTLPTGPAGPATGNVATPVLGDLDNDLDSDLLFPIFSTSRLFVFRSLQTDHRLWEPTVDVVTFDDHGETEGRLRIEVDNPAVTPSSYEGASHIEVALFRKPGPSQPMQSQAIQYWLVPMVQDVAGGGPEYTFEVEYLEPAGFTSLHFWYQRCVHASGGIVERVYPADIRGLTSDSSVGTGPTPGLDYLVALPGSGEVVPVFSGGGEDGGGGEVPPPHSTGTHVDESPIPDFDEDDEPSTGL